MKSFVLKLLLAICLLLLVVSAAFSQPEVSKFEVGTQLSLLSLSQPNRLVGTPFDPGFIGVAPAVEKRTEPGFGGRFTFNLTSNVGFEAEGNLFPRNRATAATPSGQIFQGQFGVKIGKRLKRFGMFGKVRPGFVGFTQVTKLLSTSTVANLAGLPPFVVGRFGQGKALYFSADLGVAVEHYISRRIFTRFDVGDTIIRYGTFVGPGTFLSHAIITRPPETKHSLQFNAGVGFRF